MPRIPTIARCLLPLALAAAAPAQVQATPAATMLPELVGHFCGECHRGDEAEQGFDLDAVFATPAAADLRGRAALAITRVRSRTMPPVDEELQPTAADRAALAVALAAVVPADADASAVTMRRLSRREYEHAVQDLCGVPFAAQELLPEDPRAYGFDNVGDVMTVSPLLFEQYFAAAGAIAATMVADEAACARVFADGEPMAATLSRFLARAFRRPATDAEVAERVAVYEQAIAAGGSVAAARAAVVQSILASPLFLFRVECGRDDDPSVLTPHELATRLAFFATSSLPDDPLRAQADAGALADSATLVAELQRLVAATGGRRLAEGFAAQWLRSGDVLTASADFRRYPQIWNGQLRPAFLEEATQFFAALVRDDASVLALLDADFTFLDETLSKHYGFGDVKGREFVRVPVPDRRRGGILGMGAMLMVTSYPLRTSPVLRGRWILDQLLDEAPPPPPANAGTLPADDVLPDELTLRARLEHHRRAPSCANCHAQMDPLGFALENWDVLGRWRDDVAGKPIDAKATLPDGTALDGPVALKDALLARKHDFVRAMLKKLLVYAIGRPLAPADERELLRLVDVVVAADCRFSAMLGAVVTSPLFTHRSGGGVR